MAKNIRMKMSNMVTEGGGKEGQRQTLGERGEARDGGLDGAVREGRKEGGICRQSGERL